MAGIFHNFSINASIENVFRGISTTQGLDSWWTKTSAGEAREGSIYLLDFGPGYQWKARVVKAIANEQFELEFTEADTEWTGTKTGFLLKQGDKAVLVSFYHTGWAAESENYKYSSYCWAMYLRILKRNLEYGETVAYEKRLSV